MTTNDAYFWANRKHTEAARLERVAEAERTRELRKDLPKWKADFDARLASAKRMLR